jgi:hypothetical protein
MTEGNDQSGARGWRTAAADLTFLVSAGISSKALESCRGLEYSVRRELGVSEELRDDERAVLLNEVLSAAIAEQRQAAFDQRDEDTVGSAAGRPANQNAAAGELLGLTDDEQWRQIRDLRCRQFDETWDGLRAKAGTIDPLTERRLRAMLWLGFGSVRTVERGQPGLLHALESEIKEYARKNRDALLAVVADERPYPPPPAMPSPASAVELQSFAGKPGEMPPRRRKSVWATIVVAAVGTAIVVSVLAWRADDPVTEAGSASSVSSLAPTRPAAPGPSTPTRPATRGPSTPTPSPGITRLAQLPRCHHLPRESPLAKRLRAAKQAIIDGRCDADPSTAVVAHSRPTRRSPAVDRLRTGQVVDDICLSYGGQKTHNRSGASSRVWVGYRPTRSKQYTYAPAIWVQGEEGARHCRPSAHR